MNIRFHILNPILLACSVFTVTAAVPAAATRPQTEAPQGQEAPIIPVHGVVVDSNGFVVTDGIVVAEWVNTSASPPPLELTISADGGFSGQIQSLTPQELLNAVLRITAACRNKGICIRSLNAERLKFKALKLVLAQATTVKGRLINLSGNPVAGINVGLVAGSHFNTELDTTGLPDHCDSNLLRHVVTLELPSVVAALFQTTTGFYGQFEIPGCPLGMSTDLQVGGGFVFGIGKPAAYPILSPGVQDIGLVTVARPGTVTVRAINRWNGEPCNPYRLCLQHDTGPQYNILGDIGKDGRVHFTGLVPGPYHLVLEDLSIPVRVEEGRETNLPDISGYARSGPLDVDVVNSDGGFVPGCDITVYDPLDKFRPRILGPAKEIMGQYVFEEFPWRDATVTVSAVHGSDFASWTGAAEMIKDKLVLKLKPDALGAVTGRLLDKDGRPLQKAAFLAWLRVGSDISSRLKTARYGISDSDGRFRISGLQRGEAYSIAVGYFAVMSGDFPYRGDLMSRVPDSETPGFTVADLPSGTVARSLPDIHQTAPIAQDVGDLVVHPSKEIADYADLHYSLASSFGGFTEAEPPSHSYPGESILPIPSTSDVTAATKALKLYCAAVKAGDVSAVHNLMSRISNGWSDNIKDFALSCSMTLPATNGETPYPMRVVEQKALESTFETEMFEPIGSNEGDRVAQNIQSDPHFVVFVQRLGSSLAACAVLHRDSDDNKWRVVAGSGLSLLPMYLTFEPKIKPANGDFPFESPPVPALALQEDVSGPDVITVARAYMRDWANEDWDAMQRLTSRESPWYGKSVRPSPVDLKGRGGGACPVRSDEFVNFEPVSGLSNWDVFELVTRSRNQIAFPFRPERFGIGSPAIALSWSDVNESRKVAALRYTAQGQSYLMLLNQIHGKWRVVDPSIEM